MEDVYVAADAAFDDEPACSARLLEELHDPTTTRHMTRLGVDDGWRCLEVGVGEGSIAATGSPSSSARWATWSQATSILGSETTLLCSTTPRCANTTSPKTSSKKPSTTSSTVEPCSGTSPIRQQQRRPWSERFDRGAGCCSKRTMSPSWGPPTNPILLAASVESAWRKRFEFRECDPNNVSVLRPVTASHDGRLGPRRQRKRGHDTHGPRWIDRSRVRRDDHQPTRRGDAH